MRDNKLQMNEQDKLRQFLTIGGFERDQLIQILDISESFAALPGHQVKKVPLLRGRIITNRF